jgi:putative redox protein
MMDNPMKAKVELVSNMKFVGVPDSGHSVVMDSSAAGGEDSAAKPMEVLLIALGCCTGMDVVSILRKMRVKFEGFEIEINGNQGTEHPRIFSEVELVYKVKGKGLPYDKIERAVKLSQEKYCPLSATLRPTAKVNYKIKLVEDEE